MAGGWWLFLTLNFSARAGSINYPGNPLPTEITSWREKSRLGSRTGVKAWVDVGPSGWETPLGTWPATFQSESHLHHRLALTFDNSLPLSEPQFPPSHIEINEASPCGL